MRKRFLSLMLALMLLGSAAAAEGVWMLAVSAGKADALLLGLGDATILVDAGTARSMGKLKALMGHMGVTALDAVFLTHTDDDHAEGLQWLAESDIPVGAWYASKMYTGIKKESKHPAVKAAAVRGQEVQWLMAGDRLTLGEAELQVLAPEVRSDDSDDDNSLVMLLETQEGRLLLTGDMELYEEALLLDGAPDLSCDVLKVPNHADDDTCSDALLRACQPKMAIICTDSQEKPETPDPRILATLQALGAETHVTQECTGGLLVRLEDGAPSVTRLTLKAPEAGLSLLDVTPGDDTIELINEGAARSLEGWYLYSSRGGELFVFPEGVGIGSGETLVVGSKSSEGIDCDLIWDDKKVVHESKTDRISLCAPNGLEISAMTNGM